MPTYVGLDCGGSASRVLAVDEKGDAIFRGQSGPANLVSTPTETIERNLRRASAGCPEATAVCGAFAGLIGPKERTHAERLLHELFPAAAVRAEPDYAAAHAAAPKGTRITVIAGTGSLVCGDGKDGKLVKSGGRGYLLGDEGSGFRFGRAALMRFLRHPDSSTPPLGAAGQSLFDTREEAAIVSAVYGKPSPQTLLARLLPAFASDLEAGQTYAETFAIQEEAELADVVATLLEGQALDAEDFRIALSGGLWGATPKFESHFQRALEERLPDRRIRLERLTTPPVRGAVALAKETARGN